MTVTYNQPRISAPPLFGSCFVSHHRRALQAGDSTAESSRVAGHPCAASVSPSVDGHVPAACYPVFYRAIAIELSSTVPHSPMPSRCRGNYQANKRCSLVDDDTVELRQAANQQLAFTRHQRRQYPGQRENVLTVKRAITTAAASWCRQ